MNVKRAFLTLIIFLSVFIICQKGDAFDVTPMYQYEYHADPEIPDTLYVGQTVELGKYSIRLLQQPTLGKYLKHFISDNDLEYLTIRIALTNNSDAALGWLNSDSFRVIETYKGKMYSGYGLDIPVSAVEAGKFGQNVYFEKIEPGETLYTSLVFSVYPDVDGWIMRLALHSYYEDLPAEPILFMLPDASRYSGE